MSASIAGPVLVVADPTDAEGIALARAIRLAESLSASLELFAPAFDQALEGSHFHVTERLEAARDARVAASGEWLEAQAAPLRERGLSVATRAVYANPRHEAIARRALETGAALVVMRTDHHEWLARATLGATDWQLIRICPAPLLLAKGREWPATPRVLAAVDPGHRDDRHALLDHAILDQVQQLVEGLGAEAWVGHCVFSMASLESTATLGMMPEALGAAPEDYASELMKKLRAEVLRLLEDRPIPEARLRIAEGRPEKQLPRLVDDLGIDVLVTGGVSRSRLGQVFIGGTAERLLERVDCDLLIVKPPGFHAPLD